MKHLGQELDKLIVKRGLKKNVLSKELGISTSWMTKLKDHPSLDAAFLERICAILGISPAVFFDDYNPDEKKENITASVNTTAILGVANTNVQQEQHRDYLEEIIRAKEAVIKEKEERIKLLEKMNENLSAMLAGK